MGRSICGNIGGVTDVLGVFMLLFQAVLQHFITDSLKYTTDNKDPIINASHAFMNETYIMKYILIILVMGLAPLPAIYQYWKNDELGLYGNRLVQNTLSKKLFWLINSGFHGQVREVIQILNTTFKYHWNLFKHVVIDESIIAFKGRIHFRQHIFGKPHSTGLKIYGMADESGFLWSFWLYEGADGGQRAKPTDIVMDFIEQIPGDVKQHIIITDSYYGSVDLAQKCTDKGYKFLFCCKSDKPSALFKDILHKSLKKHEWKLSLHQDLNIIALSYHDRSICNFITNCTPNPAEVFCLITIECNKLGLIRITGR